VRRGRNPSVKIRSIVFGPHPSARWLNPWFARESSLVKLSVDVAPGPEPATAFRRAVSTLVRRCPSLKRHVCAGADGGSFLEGTGNPSDDLAHLLEHLIIDLGSRITSLDTMSGVTCGHLAPPNRYDIFVESDRKQSAEFVTRLAVWALDRAVSGEPDVPSLYRVIRAYALVEERPALLRDVTAFGRAARLPAAEAGPILRIVRRLRETAT
jgi:hypothetical protein